MGEGDARFDLILSLAPCVNHATYLLCHHSIKRIGSSGLHAQHLQLCKVYLMCEVCRADNAHPKCGPPGLLLAMSFDVSGPPRQLSVIAA